MEGDINYTAEVILATAVDDPASYGINHEVPVEIVHISADERQLKRKRSQSLLNLHLSDNLLADSVATKKQIIETSSTKSNNANEPFNGLENMDLFIGPPNATSSPIR